MSGQTGEGTGGGCVTVRSGLQRSPMSLSSALRESDLPFMLSRLSRSRDRSLDERSLSLDDLRREMTRVSIRLQSKNKPRDLSRIIAMSSDQK